MAEQSIRLTRSPDSGKPQVRVFLSFADKDASIVEKMWDLLVEATEIDRTYEFVMWRFNEAILIGETWESSIRDALKASELGVLAISNAFLRSKYIAGVELPALVDVPGKRVVPVLVRETSLHGDWHGLDSRQVYGRHRPFSEIQARSGQDTWVNELVNQLHRVLSRYAKITER